MEEFELCIAAFAITGSFLALFILYRQDKVLEEYKALLNRSNELLEEQFDNNEVLMKFNLQCILKSALDKEYYQLAEQCKKHLEKYD